MNLFKASNQWAMRPKDERFSSLQEMDSIVNGYKSKAAESSCAYQDLEVVVGNNEPVIVGTSGKQARFTHYAFGQLCQRIGAPAGYLRELGPELTATCLMHGLNLKASSKTEDKEASYAKMLFHQEEGNGLVVRAFTSERYTRIWNSEVTSRLDRLVKERPQWQPAPAAFDGSRGLYASDHDMFCFLVDNERRIFEKDPNGGLSRGFFVWNSEVGASSFGVMTFLYEYVCGNHIVWGAKGVTELRVRHIGEANDRAFRGLTCELQKYAESSARDDEAKIERARTLLLGATKDEVLDKVFGLRIVGLSKAKLEDAYELAENENHIYGDPKSVWGMVNGITQLAREIPFADSRVGLDRAAGKVMQIAF